MNHERLIAGKLYKCGMLNQIFMFVDKTHDDGLGYPAWWCSFLTPDGTIKKFHMSWVYHYIWPVS